MYTQRGQIGIVLLLMTVVMMTVGISVVSRSTSDIKISNTNEEANKALDAAESGVENALSQDLNTFPSSGSTQGSTGQIGVTTNVTRLTTLEARVDQGETVGVDLTGVAANTIVTLNWAKETNCAQQASLVATVFNTSAGPNPPPVRRYYFGLRTGNCDNQRTTNDNFALSNLGTVASFSLSNTITTQAGDFLIRIRPLYNSTDLRVSGIGLPTQAYAVRSQAQNQDSKETKVVEVNRTLPVAPSVFDYVLYSGTSITP